MFDSPLVQLKEPPVCLHLLCVASRMKRPDPRLAPPLSPPHSAGSVSVWLRLASLCAKFLPVPLELDAATHSLTHFHTSSLPGLLTNSFVHAVAQLGGRLLSSPSPRFATAPPRQTPHTPRASEFLRASPVAHIYRVANFPRRILEHCAKAIILFVGARVQGSSVVWRSVYCESHASCPALASLEIPC